MKSLYAVCACCRRLIPLSGWRENGNWLLAAHYDEDGKACSGSRKPVEGKTFTPYSRRPPP